MATKNNELLKQMTGESDDTLLSSILLRAERQILAKTNRTRLIGPLEDLCLELAIYKYNKMGSEGESSRSEGGVSVSYTDDIPQDILSILNNYRLARVSGHAFEKK